MRAVATLALLMAMPAAAQTPADTAAITALGAQWEAAWNRRDAAALATVLADDADFLSVIGPAGRGRGKEGFVAFHARMFETVFAQSQWTNQKVDVRFLKPDVAVAHVEWRTTGADGRWLVQASQNTEVPQPGAAPAPAG